METFKGINAALTFLLELGMLAGLGFFGFTTQTSVALQWILGLGLPLIAIMLWSRFAAPRASDRLKAGWLVLFRIVMFELAALAIYLAGNTGLAIGFGAVALANQLLFLPGEQ